MGYIHFGHADMAQSSSALQVTGTPNLTLQFEIDKKSEELES